MACDEICAEFVVRGDGEECQQGDCVARCAEATGAGEEREAMRGRGEEGEEGADGG